MLFRTKWKFTVACGKLIFALANEYKLFESIKFDISIRLYCICPQFLNSSVHIILSSMALASEHVPFWLSFNEDAAATALLI